MDLPNPAGSMFRSVRESMDHPVLWPVRQPSLIVVLGDRFGSI